MKILKHAHLFLLILFSISAGVSSAQTAPSGPEILRIRYVTLMVKNYDDALAWYTGILGFKKIQDSSYGPGQRWVIIAPPGQPGQGIVLDVPKPDDKDSKGIGYSERVGKETNWVLEVNDCQQFYDVMSKRGVHFLQAPVKQPWGTTQAIFEDLYGNIFVVESGHVAT